MVDFVSDPESLVQQKSIYVAMAISVVITFSDPIANVQGLAFLQLDPKRLQRHSLPLQHRLNFVEQDFPRRKQSRPRLQLK